VTDKRGLGPGMAPAEVLGVVRAMLRELGTGDDEIAAAEADGTLPLLAVERLIVPEPLLYDLDHVTDRTQLSADQVRHLWRSLGFPVPRPGERAFTAEDVAILSDVGALVAADVASADLVQQMSRVIGSSVARIASSQVDVISAATLSRGDGDEPPRAGSDDADMADRVVAGAATLLPVVPRVLISAWRRHLQVAARRRLAYAGEEQLGVVGFADLVGFTALSQQIGDAELAAIVDQFEQLAFDVVTEAGGRVVKMIGDEVMFTVETPEAGAEIALALAEGTRDADDLSDLRVGLAHGPLLEREGDLYGPVVNLAARMTAIAFPGTILVDAPIRDHLVRLGEYRLRPMRPRYLKDIGRVPLWVLRRAASVESRFAERRRALRQAVRARVEHDESPTADG
jgi:adenylate cyclase